MGGLTVVLLKLAIFGVPLAIYFVRRARDAAAEPDPEARKEREKTLMKEFAPIVVTPLLAMVAIVLLLMGVGDWVIYFVLGVGLILVIHSLKVRLGREGRQGSGK